MMPRALTAPPAARPDYDRIPRGNTQKHVNREVLRYLLERSGLNPAGRVLDVPCGAGELLTLLRQYWPAATLAGCDLRPDAPALPGLHYRPADLSQPFAADPAGPPFDLITSVSGVMMFGNTQTFVASCAGQLRPGGQLLITNDNVLTVRDRLSYLFTGRVRRFKLLFGPDEAITQLVQHQELLRLLTGQGLRVREVVYTSFYTEDLPFALLALLLYPVQWLYVRGLRHPASQALRRQLFGFRSLVCRHYIVVAEKPAA